MFAVEQGLLGGSPDMQITGNQSSAFDLNWYQDRSLSLPPSNGGFRAADGVSVADVAVAVLAGSVTAQLAEMGLKLLCRQRPVE
ncbi:MAG: hypothetical protein O2966_03750 [Proteobacteria bacterium]|nr:hypothetical protein [Pseudomonadota bacterium]